MVLNYRDFLKAEFARRSKANKSYSLRAFARDAGLSASTLSEVLKGLKGLSLEKAKAISENLKFDSGRRSYFIDLVRSQHGKTLQERKSAKARLKKIEFSSLPALEAEVVRSLSNWAHFAVLELTALDEFEPKISWIAERLGLAEKEAQEIVERLERIGMLDRSQGRWIDTQQCATTTDHVTSEDHRKLHRQMLDQAAMALDEQAIDSRYSNSIIFALSEGDQAEVKSLIDRFKEDLSAIAERSKGKSSVRAVVVHSFALTKKKT